MPVLPIIGVLLCLYLMTYLDRDTWLRFAGRLVIGLVIYFAYGRRHSRLRHGEVMRHGEVINPEAELPGPEGRA